MQIEIFTICDSVHVYGGKSVVSGAFNQLKVKTVPVTVQNIALALRVSFESTEAGDKTFDFRFKNPDGTKCLDDIRCDAKISSVEGKYSPLSTLDMNIVFNNLKFEQFGVYSIEVINGDDVHTLKFSVEQA